MNWEAWREYNQFLVDLPGEKEHETMMVAAAASYVGIELFLTSFLIHNESHK